MRISTPRAPKSGRVRRLGFETGGKGLGVGGGGAMWRGGWRVGETISAGDAPQGDDVRHMGAENGAVRRGESHCVACHGID